MIHSFYLFVKTLGKRSKKKKEVIINSNIFYDKRRRRMKKAAIYCRLSVEDSKEQESESIQNQKLLLTDYAIEKGFFLYHIYCDEHYSGMDKNRPAFQAMLEDAKKGLFEIILCKTQSRFTRDIEVFEKYVHELFPLWGIQLISVVDKIDSNNKENKKVRQINALINEWYCEDLSENIKAVLKRKRKAGQFVGAFTCYGYQKSSENKHKLVVDKEAAEVVKRIFDSFLKGYRCKEIADMLTQEGILTPTQYKKAKGIAFQNPNAKQNTTWSYNTIKKILTNEYYIGSLVQGKEKKINYKYKKRILTDKKDWIVIKKNHQAIVEEEIFYMVQRQFQKREKKCRTTPYNPKAF